GACQRERRAEAPANRSAERDAPDRTATRRARPGRPDAAADEQALHGRAPAGDDRAGAGDETQARARGRADRQPGHAPKQGSPRTDPQSLSGPQHGGAARSARPASGRVRRSSPRAPRWAASRVRPRRGVRVRRRASWRSREALMSLGEILFLYRARLRERVVVLQELLAVVGIAVGVALLFASQVASTSLDSSVRELSKQLVGATQYQLDARGPEGFSERVVDEVRSLPDVRAALPLLEQQASVIGPAGRASVDLIGADPRLARLGGPLLRRFGSEQLARLPAIALPAPLAASIGAGALLTI